MKQINLDIIAHANFHYRTLDYKELYVPWAVSRCAIDATLPEGLEAFPLQTKYLVGSAEQSFIELMIEGKLSPGRYFATTPCFRDEKVLDELHHTYFLKTELINTEDVSIDSLELMINQAQQLFHSYNIQTEIVKTGDNQFDIVEKSTKIELGSYGIGKHLNYVWVYGTGVAEPRFSTVLHKVTKAGYHDEPIPKGDLGEFSKITEEYFELRESLINDNKVVILCELVDLVGAIEQFTKFHFGNQFSLNDLIKMKYLNERAFRNNKR